ncbi:MULTISPECIES: Imm51 family immunity protein [unclassified Rhodococcus (in: high G+C Gram-positive bacteria)]|uniref:Imm51 family immunity protein n=1 Tax=unclassified Rhodococcus (in: high G+C Gram-positive bacteria) TaxID=192944 RepID=UPI0024B64B9E|nr:MULTISPECIES: Imm51 family immunity protein [unclassified Rhodococcus (in: high G+C Gram-positive bacteria)]MDI9959389.1 Imm51 family immunity protein [Rhodococcus sp. IEGM 1237]MDI9965036.1 Imm51 family immunity protein [Rhodococcus sp. IEGM 1251]MDV8127472.1 Imm51 family immunity protein [Rhodococcus sp. IEGM 1304]
MTSPSIEPLQLFETSPGNWSLMLTDQHFGKVASIFEQVEGFEGSGYDWASVAHAVVGRDAPHLEGRFGTDPEAGMFVAYGSDNGALGELGALLVKAYSDAEYLGGLVAISELD